MNHRNALNFASLLTLLALQACSTTNEDMHAAHHGAARRDPQHADELGSPLYENQYTMDAAMLAKMRGVDDFAAYTD